MSSPRPDASIPPPATTLEEAGVRHLRPPPAHDQDAAVWVTEWAVEITWVDWRKAGVRGPTSTFEGFTDPGHIEAFLETQRIDHAVASTRVFERRAAHTAWQPISDPDPTSDADRDAWLVRHYKRLGMRLPAEK